MVKCTFCGRVMVRGTGMMVVKNDGRIFYLCSSKCKKNLVKLNRKPGTVKWTKRHKK